MGWLLAQEWVEAWLRAMSRASLYGSLAITGGWLICRWLPRMSPAAKSWVWRVVYLKLILLVLWPGTIPVPLLPSPGVRIERAQAPAQVSSAVRESSAASRGPSPGAGKSLPGESGPAAARFATVA